MKRHWKRLYLLIRLLVDYFFMLVTGGLVLASNRFDLQRIRRFFVRRFGYWYRRFVIGMYHVWINELTYPYDPYYYKLYMKTKSDYNYFLALTFGI